MTDTREFAVQETLRNDVAVTIRAVRSDDREPIAEAFRQLARESVYTRFFSYKQELSAADLAPIDSMDFVNDVMLVVTTRAAGGEAVIGSARYIACDTPDGVRTAEVAFTVEEDYQGLGIAGRLLRHLVAIARGCAIARFQADVLPGNRAMLGVFARSGLPLRERRDPGVIHVDLDLAPGPGVTP